MPRYYLKSLGIEGFRGINNKGAPLVIDFKPGAVNSIHAPNAIGKTSIFEAIHYALFDEVPRLSELQGAERPHEYINNLFHSGDATIELIFSADDSSEDVHISIHRTAEGLRTTKSASGHPNPEEFLRSLREDFVLVDYRKFFKFIDNSPLLRGRSFATLVGLSKYSFQRQALAGANEPKSFNTDFKISTLESEIKSLKGQLEECSRKMLAAYADITGETLQDEFDVDNLCTKATETLKKIDQLKSSLGASSILSADLEAAKKTLEVAEGSGLREQQLLLTIKINALKSLAPNSKEIAETEILLKLAASRDDALLKIGSAPMRELYQSASTIVEDSRWLDPYLCPVCDARSSYKLIDHIAVKLAQYSQVDEFSSKLESAVTSSEIIGRLGKLETSDHLSVPINEQSHGSLIQCASQHTLSLSSLQNAITRLGALEERREILLNQALGELKVIENSLPQSLFAVTNVLAAACIFREAVINYKAIQSMLMTANRRMEIFNSWKLFIGKAADAFSRAEANLAEKRIGSLKAKYQLLFTDLVRGGPDMQPTLERSQKTEQLELILDNFYGLQGISARAVLSESYRNAIAASVFLTAAITHSGKPRFMILDDVTSSFDSGHQFSLMEGIRTQLQQPNNPCGLQFIILSHEASLEKYFDTHNSSGTEWHHQKLQGMPPQGQIMVSAHESDRLRKLALTHLDAGDVTSGAPLIRQYLEYKLGKIISDLHVLVPPDYATRGDKRTLATYLNAIIESVKLFDQAGRCVLTKEQIQDLTKRHSVTIMANFVSHYETGCGTPFGPDALKGVLQNIDALVDCFTFEDATKNPPVKKFYQRLDKR